MSRDKIKNLLAEYANLKPLYRDFSIAVKFILETILERNQFKYQIVTNREKEVESLERKLIENKGLQKIRSVQQVDDLVGCRIIFYIESDIQRFITHIHNEFNIIKQNLRYSDDDYNASHIVIKLNKDRLKLSEYAKFKNLKCEIQLTTVLYHAWSEMAHDIIFKPEKELSEFDKHAFESLKKQFADVMKNHIKQAQHSFNFIEKEIEKIRQGKQIFDANFLKAILSSKSNNELYERLKILHQYVEEFGDKTPRELDIIKIVKESLKKSKSLKTKPIKTVLGRLKGYGYSEIADVCLDILDQLRYYYPKEVFSLLIELSLDKDAKIKKKSLEGISTLSKYTLFVKDRKIYYGFQISLLDEIEKLLETKQVIYFDSVIEIANQLLTPTFEGHSWKDYQTVILHSGALPVNENLKKIRERTIEIFKKLYSYGKNLKEKQKIIQTLQKASKTPFQKYGKDMEKMVLENTNTLIDYYISIVRNADNEIVKEIEEQMHWFIRRFGKERLLNIERLRSLIASRDSYQLFRVFVGHGFRISEDIDWKKADEERKKKIQEFIDDISERNFNEWMVKILSVIKNYSVSDDKGQFQYFNFFLNELGKQKPEIAYKLLILKEKELESFLIHLVAGIWKSKKKKPAEDLIKKWIDKNKYLPLCAYIFDYVEEIDKVLLEKIFQKAKEDGDINTLNNIIKAVVRNYPKYKNTKTLFIDSVEELTKKKNWLWIDYVWFRKESMLNDLTAGEFNIVLENLLLAPNIDYQIEEILKPIAEKYPKKVLDYFRKRISIQAKKKEEDRYDAVPFDLHKLNEPLGKQAKVIVEEVLKWFNEKDWLLYWEGSHLLQAIFPNFSNVLEKKLIDLLRSGKKNRAKIVFYILRAYKGEEFLHNVCKEFIRQYPKNDKYHREMFILLSQMGVVGGEYGFVEGYKKKKESVQSWKNDKNRVIQNFVKKYEEYLDKQIIYEKRRADEDIELRKGEFES